MSSYNKRYNTRSSDTTTSSGTSKRAKKTETGGADNNPEPNDTKPTARKQPSKVALKGSGSGKSTESALKKKEKMEEMTKQLKKEQKELEKKLRYHKKALKVILEKSGKTGKTGKTDNNIPVHTILQGAYEELGMEKKGMSYDTTAIKQNSNILLPGSANAMAQQTSPMDAKQVSRCEYRLRTHPSRMDGGKMGFTFGKKTTTNTKNQTVNLNASNANRVGYEYSEKHDYGLGKHNREKALDLEPQMIELCNNHEWIASIPESRNRNTLVIAETPDEDEEPYYGDIVGQYLGYDNFRSLSQSIGRDSGVLPKMSVTRFIGNQIVTQFQKGMTADKYKRAGYYLSFANPENKFSKN